MNDFRISPCKSSFENLLERMASKLFVVRLGLAIEVLFLHFGPGSGRTCGHVVDLLAKWAPKKALPESKTTRTPTGMEIDHPYASLECQRVKVDGAHDESLPTMLRPCKPC